MYSMNWETYSFMHVRHVPPRGTLSRGGGGQFVAIVHSMQRCKLPHLCKAHQFYTAKRTTYM